MEQEIGGHEAELVNWAQVVKSLHCSAEESGLDIVRLARHRRVGEGGMTLGTDCYRIIAWLPGLLLEIVV